MARRWAQAPDLIEPIVGYRLWRHETDRINVRFLPLGVQDDVTAWKEWDGAWRRWVTASCRLDSEPDGDVPNERCTCGFYAMKSPNEPELLMMVSLDGARSGSDPQRGIVMGRVHLAGKVIEHDRGYRAERARIVELIPTTEEDAETKTIAIRLGLPLAPAIQTWHVPDMLSPGSQPQPVGRTRPLGPVERLRLRVHRRRFRVIEGGSPTVP
ncbi:MAG TPA: hypothetical protein VF195_02620 [Actinomycetota bacterium]